MSFASFKKVVFVVMLSLLLAGGTSVRWACAAEGEGAKSEKAEANKESKKEEGGKSEEGDKKKKKGDDESITGGRFAGDPIYVHVQPISLPIISNRGAEQIVTMLIDLHVKDFDTATNMHENMPKMKDALLQALYGGFADGSLREKNMLDLPKIKESVKITVGRVFGEDAVQDVLIQAVAQRRL